MTFAERSNIVMLDIEELLTGLARRRRIFHSEADLQHALAWEIHREIPTANVRLEYKPDSKKAQNVDVWVVHENGTLVFELKYKTRELRLTDGNEEFLLKTAGAQDIGRYDFLKDVERLQNIIADHRDTVGYALMLTNDKAYWNPPTRPNTAYEQFRLDEGWELEGKRKWGPTASGATIEGREDPIALRGLYKFRWKDYSEPIKHKNGLFRYLLVRAV